jgi:predicted Holliday junction resolvase-like endonuclease
MKNFQEKASTLIKTEMSKLAEHVESTNKKLSEDLTRQIREENAKLKEEFARKLEAEVRKFENDMDKLRKDTGIEIVSLNQNVETVRAGVSEQLTGHFTETDQRIDRVTQEVNAKTTILATDLTQHITQTGSDIQALRQEVA